MASQYSISVVVLTVLLVLMGGFSLVTGGNTVVGAATWCVARSDASDQALQTALDYACGAGADCTPIESSGLCFLPNTLQAHASYAFNSFYQRKAAAPGACDFSGTATVARTDPSFGSCVYPSSPSTAGGTGTPTTIPGLVGPPPPPLLPGTSTPIYGGGGTPGFGPVVPAGTDSRAFSRDSIQAIFVTFYLSLYLCFVL